MRAVVQRVRSAAVQVGDETIARIGPGLAVLLGVATVDRPEDGERLAAKILALRIFDDDRGRLDRTVLDIRGAVLVIPQFTLYGDVRHGRRPDFAHAAPPDLGRRLFDAFCGVLRGADANVSAGRFGANMRVELEGDGPVTIVVSTDAWAEADIGRHA
ncbi:MAG: D-tyrosyl-tRNA(Tyr) deacylase [Chloroflexi bacterium]|nr:MAG: D-tyrosyl-tRNA(Tyr) deacylase [Chloroflexota bacterium]TMC26524.1 MAG: D-tyrosyl-tRNA(Tyr) deacylase [Chloroflexota bacterium]TMC34051.1 MAG: D-tyrosyl-tRNA(Tyr) deacylase [Chloroflexota bacterium]TME43972.1 MAG: D-tyrosyl-tRNA(Tyr) deacylase [Chloroflexota bacterium]